MVRGREDLEVEVEWILTYHFPGCGEQWGLKSEGRRC